MPPDDEDKPPLAPAEIDELRPDYTVLPAEHALPDEYPRLTNMSIGLMKRAIVRPVERMRPEYVTVSLPIRDRGDDDTIKKYLAVAEWNLLWEAGQYRRRFFDEEQLTPDLECIADRGDLNIIFVPRTPSR
jgi:hypothetical protein